MSELQQKFEMIGKLRGKVDQVKTDCHRWKENIDRLAADKKGALALIASAETQLLGIKVKNISHNNKIKELEFELD